MGPRTAGIGIIDVMVKSVWTKKACRRYTAVRPAFNPPLYDATT